MARLYPGKITRRRIGIIRKAVARAIYQYPFWSLRWHTPSRGETLEWNKCRRVKRRRVQNGNTNRIFFGATVPSLVNEHSSSYCCRLLAAVFTVIRAAPSKSQCDQMQTPGIDKFSSLNAYSWRFARFPTNLNFSFNIERELNFTSEWRLG